MHLVFGIFKPFVFDNHVWLSFGMKLDFIRLYTRVLGRNTQSKQKLFV